MNASRPVRVFIGLGSNLDQPRTQIARAIEALRTLPQSSLTAVSSRFVSPPLGPQDQPDFINAVAELETGLEPLALLDHLREIERAQGRTRELRWGPRTLDLDLLVYGDERIVTPELTVPHPGLPERAFVLYPLAELAPDLAVPGYGTAAALAARVAPNGIRLDE